MGQDGKGGSVQARQSLAEVLVGQLVCVRGALEVSFVLGESAVLALGASLLVLQRLAAALVALVVNLSRGSAAAAGQQAVCTHLCIFALLDGLFHGLQGIAGQLGGHDEFAVNVLDLLHHVRLEFGKGLVQSMDTLQDGGGSFGMDMGGGAALAAEGLEDGVEALDRRQLVIEDVCPRVSPLLGRGFELGVVVSKPCLAPLPPVQRAMAGENKPQQRDAPFPA